MRSLVQTIKDSQQDAQITTIGRAQFRTGLNTQLSARIDGGSGGLTPTSSYGTTHVLKKNIAGGVGKTPPQNFAGGSGVAGGG